METNINTNLSDLEEAAKRYATYERSDGDGGVDLTRLEGFIAGAKWDRKKIIDKACDYIASLRRLDDDVVYDFRKAMEG